MRAKTHRVTEFAWACGPPIEKLYDFHSGGVAELHNSSSSHPEYPKPPFGNRISIRGTTRSALGS